MKFMNTTIVTIVCFIVGLLFHAYQKEWIILLLPHKTIDYQTQNSNETSFTQKNIMLFFWKNEKWQKEQNSIIWSYDMTHNIKTIINNWLILLEDEKIIDSDIQIISAMITAQKELFLSLNKDLFKSQDATHAKLMIVHSLLKTIHENKIPIQSVRLLVHHQILMDDHLNFSISWPVTGYLTKS